MPAFRPFASAPRAALSLDPRVASSGANTLAAMTGAGVATVATAAVTTKTLATMTSSATGTVDLLVYAWEVLTEPAATNLLAYSQTTPWTNSGTTYTNYAGVAPDGSFTADKIVLNAGTRNSEAVSRTTVAVTSGNTYTTSLYVKALGYTRVQLTGAVFNGGTWNDTLFDLTNNTVVAGGGGVTFRFVTEANGWVRIIGTWVASANGTPIMYVKFVPSSVTTVNGTHTADGTSGGLTWGGQVELGAAATPYIPTTTTSVARAAHGLSLSTASVVDAVANVWTILTEPAATNLIIQSETFSPSWGKAAAVSLTPYSGVAPNGSYTAVKVTGSDNYGWLNRSANGGTTSGTVYTASVYAKAGATSTMNMFIGSNDSNNGINAVFNIATGAVITAPQVVGTGANGRYAIASVGNGWYRIELSGSYTGTASTMVFGGAYLSTFDYQLWGAQFEVGSVATPYIPTTSAPVSRTAHGLSLSTNSVADVAANVWDTLTEPAATNIVIRSQALGTSPWAVAGTSNVSDNAATAPDGTMTATLVTPTSSYGGRSQTIAVSGNTTYTASVYEKWVSGNTSLNFTLFDVTNSVVLSSQAVVVNGSWQRFTVTFTTAANTASVYFMVRDTGASGFGAFQAWGAQLETGSVATPYIPTTTSSVTRTAHGLSLVTAGVADVVANALEYFTEPATTNLVTNGNAVGASGTTMPTGWQMEQAYGGVSPGSMLQATDGLGQPALQFRVAGTTSLTNRLLLAASYNAGGTRIPVTGSATYSISYNVQLVSGSITNTVATTPLWYDAGGAFVGSGNGTSRTISATTARYTDTYTVPSNAATVQLRWDFNGSQPAVSTVVDFTINIGSVQMELGAASTSYIPTTSGSASRSAHGLSISAASAVSSAAYVWDTLTEPATTNLATYSQDLSNGSWSKTGSAVITAADVAAPDGSMTAWRMSAVGGGQYVEASKLITVSPSTQYTVSAYVKAGNYGIFSIVAQGANYFAAQFVLGGATGGPGGVGFTNQVYKQEAIGNGWYRVSATVTTPASGANSTSCELGLWMGNYDGVNHATTSDYLYLWGAQFEATPAATAYLPTQASTVTRTAHGLSIAATSAVDVVSNTWKTLTEPTATNIALNSQDMTLWQIDSTSVQGVGSAPVRTANFAVAPDGTVTATRLQMALNGGTATTDRSGVNQQFAGLTNGANYVSSVWMKSNTGSSYVVQVETNIAAGGTPSIHTVTTTWQRFTSVTTAALTAGSIRIMLIGNRGTADSADILVWGAQVELGSVATPYILTTSSAVTRTAHGLSLSTASAVDVAANVWDTLTEPAATNLLPYSQDFSVGTWSKANVAVTKNATVAPDGSLSASKFAETAANGSHNAVQFVSMSLNTTYTLSMYAKAAERSHLVLNIFSGVEPSPYTWFDLSNGTIGTVGAIATPKIEAAGNGWYRCSLTVTTAASGSPNIAFWVTSANNVISYTGTVDSGIYIWGAQLEVGAKATPYIPTTTTSVARTAHGLSLAAASAVGVAAYVWDTLTEPAATNLILQSQTLDNASWGKSDTTVTADQTAAPDGTITADLLAEGSAGSSQLNQATTITAGQTLAVSRYFKRGNTDWVLVKVDSTGGANGFGQWFNLNTGAMGSQYSFGTGTFVSAQIVAAENGFYRCSVVGRVDAAATTVAVRTYNTSANNTETRVNGATRYEWGAQLEVGSVATPYILTTTSSVARTAHGLTSSGDGTVVTGAYFDRWTGSRASTNYNLHSDLMTGSTWGTLVGTFTANTVAGNAPDGGKFVKQFDFSTTGAIRFGNTVSGTGINYVGSIWIRTTDGSTKYVQTDVNDYAADNTAIDGNWKRISNWGVTANPYRFYDIAFPIGSFQLWGVQIEDGTRPTQYIPTTTAAVTRANPFGLQPIRTNYAYPSNMGSGWVANLSPTVTANAELAPDGTVSATRITSGASGQSGLWMSTALPSGVTATYSVYVRNTSTSATMKIGVDNNPTTAGIRFSPSTGVISNPGASIISSGVVALADGWWRVYATFVTTGAPSFTVYTESGTGSTAVVWGAQIELGSEPTALIPTTGGTATGTATAAIGNSAYVWDTLTEPAATNVVKYSQDFSNVFWGAGSNNTITGNFGIAPDGTLTAGRLLRTSVGGNNFLARQYCATSVGTYVASVWVKSNTGTSYAGFLRLYANSTGSSAGFTATSTWQRVSFSIADATGGGNFQFDIESLVSGADILVWGAQLELGTVPTPYIPTTSGSVTRTAHGLSPSSAATVSNSAYVWDMLTEPGATNLFTTTQGNSCWNTLPSAMVTEFMAIGPSGEPNADLITLTGTAGGPRAQRNVTVPVDTLTRVASVYIRKESSPGKELSVELGIVGGTGVSKAFRFNSFTGVATSGFGPNGNVVDVDASWWRVYVNVTNSGTTGNTTLYFWVTPAVSPIVGNETMYVWGPQVELGTVPTPFIQRAGSSTPRTAHGLSMAATSAATVTGALSARKNWVPNSIYAGGNSSTLPSSASLGGNNPSSIGLTPSYAYGIEFGMSYLEVTYTGTSTSGSAASTGIYFSSWVSDAWAIPATLNSVWTHSCWLRVIGTPVGLTSMTTAIVERTAAGSGSGTASSNVFTPTTTLTKYTVTDTVDGASTTQIQPMVSIQIPALATVNVTFRVYGTQVETGTEATPFIPTTGTGGADGGYLLGDAPSTNRVRNSVGLGVDGSSTLPYNWSISTPVSGLNRTVSIAVDRHGRPAIDIRIYGTPSSAPSYYQFGENTNGNADLAAVTGQTWVNSFYYELVAGTFPGTWSMGPQMNEQTSGGVYVSGGSIASPVPTTPDSTIRRTNYTRTLNGGGTVANINPIINFGINAGGAIAVDFTMRLSGMQMEQGAVPTNWIPTANSIQSRSVTGANLASAGAADRAAALAYSLAALVLNSASAATVAAALAKTLSTVVGPNLLAYSDDFSNGNWVAYWRKPTLTSGEADPFGGTTAYSFPLSECTGAPGADTAGVMQARTFPLSGPGAGSRTMSIYVRADQNLTVSLGSRDADTTTFTATTSWQRISFTSSVTGTSGYFDENRVLQFYTIKSGVNAGVPTTCKVYFTAAQTVMGSSALPYSKTVAAGGPVGQSAVGVAGYTWSTLTEPASTNLQIRSQEIDNGAWNKVRGTISTTLATAPDGTITADLFVEDTSVSNDHGVMFGGPYAYGTGTYTASIYLKAAGNDYAYFWIDSGSGYGVTVQINLSSGVATTTRGAGGFWTEPSVTSTNAGNGWWRLSVTSTTTQIYIQTRVYTAPTAWVSGNYGTPMYTGGGVNGVYIWGVQVETGTVATPYIPTTSTSVARLAHGLTAQRTNMVPNSTMAGAGVGTLPTGWSFQAAAGITQSIVGTGTEFGLNYVDWSITGTASAAGSPAIYVTGAGGFAVPARYSQIITGSIYYKLISGAIPNAQAGTGVQGFNPTYMGGMGSTSSTTTFNRIQATYTLPAGTTGVAQYFSCATTSGNTYAAVIRVYAPQLELGNVATDFIPTSGTAASIGGVAAAGIAAFTWRQLTEPATTNMIATSESLSVWGKGSSVTITPYAGVAPDGSYTATRVVSSDNSGWYNRAAVGGTTANTVYTMSMYAKAGVTDQMSMFIGDGPSTNGVSLTVNLTTGAVVTGLGISGTGANPRYAITSAGNGWWRVELTGSYNGTAACMTFGGTAQPFNYLVWGAQFELGSVATPYVPTQITGAPTTRAAHGLSESSAGTVSTGAVVGRKNLFPYSNLSRQGITSGTAVTVTHGTADYYGGTEATTLYDFNTGSRYPIQIAATQVAMAAGVTYTLSAQVKKVGSAPDATGALYPHIIRLTNTGLPGIMFNSYTGAYASTGPTSGTGVIDNGNGWWTVWFTLSVTGTADIPYVEIFPTHNDGIANTGTLILGDMQFEAGPRTAIERVAGPTDGKILGDEPSTNGLRYTSWTGASVSGNVIDTGWTTNVVPGVTSTVVAATAEYVDVRFTGSGATGNFSLGLATAGADGAAAAQGQTWTSSCIVEVVGGALPDGYLFAQVVERNSGASLLTASVGPSVAASVGSGLARVQSTHTLPSATAALVSFKVLFAVPTTAAVDVTLRIYQAQLEQRSTRTAWIRTNGAAASRTATGASAYGFGAVSNSAAVSKTLLNLTQLSAVQVAIAASSANTFNAALLSSASGAIVAGIVAKTVGLSTFTSSGVVVTGAYGITPFATQTSISAVQVAVVAALAKAFNSVGKTLTAAVDVMGNFLPYQIGPASLGAAGNVYTEMFLTRALSQASLEAGTGVQVAGALSKALSVVTLSADSLAQNQGSFSKSLGTLGMSGTSAVAVGATLGAYTATSTTSSTASAGILGNFSNGLNTVTGSLSASTGVAGSTAKTLGTASLSAPVGVGVAGAFSNAIGPVVVSGAGAAGVLGSTVKTLGVATTLSVITVTITAVANPYASNASLSSTSGAVVGATVAKTVADATQVAAATVATNAYFTKTLSASPLSSAVAIDVSGALAKTLSTITYTLSAGVGVTGYVTKTLNTVAIASSSGAVASAYLNSSHGAASMAGVGSVLTHAYFTKTASNLDATIETRAQTVAQSRRVVFLIR